MSLIEEDLAVTRRKLAGYIKDIDAWRFETIDRGVVSPKYKISNGADVFFVKVIPDNERNTLQLLGLAGADVSPKVVYPEALKENLLIAEYFTGTEIQERLISNELVVNYAEMQNRLNDPAFYQQPGVPAGCTFNERDDGFAKNSFVNNFQDGYTRLKSLKHFELGSVDAFIRIAENISKNIDELAETFAGMPFAWQHNDLKENNIMQNEDRQVLVDWGSSYGHWPFLTDLCIFLVNDDEACVTYRNAVAIDIPSDEQFNRWLHAALTARFIGLIKYRLDSREGFITDREKLDTFLKYELQTYGVIVPEY